MDNQPSKTPDLPIAEDAVDAAECLPAAETIETEPEYHAPRGRVTGLDRIPELWGAIPAVASVIIDIQWAMANRLSIVHETSLGGFVVDLEKAHEPAPSRSALSWLQLGIMNPSKLMDLAAKRVTEETDDEIKTVKKERKSVDELRGILAQYVDAEDERLLADIPTGVQDRTRRCVAGWIAKSGIELPEEAQTRLESAVCSLVHHCVAAIEDEEGDAHRDFRQNGG